MSGDSLHGALERLSRLSGVRGAVIVDADAGMPVLGELESDVDETAIAALAAVLVRRSAEATSASGLGELRVLQLESERGQVVASAAGELVIVVLADADAQLGLIRLEARRAAETLA